MYKDDKELLQERWEILADFSWNSYDWHEMVLYRTHTGMIGGYDDSGCSCNGPYEEWFTYEAHVGEAIESDEQWAWMEAQLQPINSVAEYTAWADQSYDLKPTPSAFMEGLQALTVALKERKKNDEQ
jgi:hypothetical protein